MTGDNDVTKFNQCLFVCMLHSVMEDSNTILSGQETDTLLTKTATFYSLDFIFGSFLCKTVYGEM